MPAEASVAMEQIFAEIPFPRSLLAAQPRARCRDIALTGDLAMNAVMDGDGAPRGDTDAGSCRLLVGLQMIGARDTEAYLR